MIFVFLTGTFIPRCVSHSISCFIFASIIHWRLARRLMSTGKSKASCNCAVNVHYYIYSFFENLFHYQIYCYNEKEEWWDASWCNSCYLVYSKCYLESVAKRIENWMWNCLCFHPERQFQGEHSSIWLHKNAEQERSFRLILISIVWLH